MKKLFGLFALLTLTGLAFWAITAGPTLAQEDVANPSSAPVDSPAADSADSVIVWPSSAPLPEGKIPQSPPDRVSDENAGTDALTGFDAYFQVAGSVFRPRTSSIEWAPSGQGGCVYASSGASAYSVFNVPIHLPAGSVVKYVRMYYHDTNATYNTMSWFTIYDQHGNIDTEYIMNSTGSSGAGYVDTIEFNKTIDYSASSYVLNWRPMDFGSGLMICGFRIYYDTPSVFLPVIDRD